MTRSTTGDVRYLLSSRPIIPSGRADDSISSVLDLSAGDDAGDGAAAVKPKTAVAEQVRIILAGELRMSVRRSVSLDDDRSIEPAAPGQECVFARQSDGVNVSPKPLGYAPSAVTSEGPTAE